MADLADLVDPVALARLRAAAADRDSDHPTDTAAVEAPAEPEQKADSPAGLERKADLPGTQVLSADETTGVVEALVSVTGIEDRVKDIIEPGAYAKTLAAREPIGVWSHDDKTWVARSEDAVELPPGDPFFKDLRLPNGQPWPREAGAVKVKARFNLDTPHGKAAFSDVQFFQGKTSWSIGYRATKSTRNPRTGVRHIKELDWFEFSPVMVGAAAQAMTLSVKSLAQPVDADDPTGLAPEALVDALGADELDRYSELKGDLEPVGAAELGVLEVKASSGKPRRVRTPEGARRFGAPIGSIIVRDADGNVRVVSTPSPSSSGVTATGRPASSPSQAVRGSAPRSSGSSGGRSSSSSSSSGTSGKDRYVELAVAAENAPTIAERRRLEGEAAKVARQNGLDEMALEDDVLNGVFATMTDAELERAGRDPSRRARARAEQARRSAAPKAATAEGRAEVREAARASSGTALGGDRAAATRLGASSRAGRDEPESFAEAAADGEPKVISLAKPGERVLIADENSPLNGKVVLIRKPVGKNDVEVIDESDRKRHKLDTYTRALPAPAPKPAATFAEQRARIGQMFSDYRAATLTSGMPASINGYNGGSGFKSLDDLEAEITGLLVDLESKASRASLDRSPGSNWVEEAGGLPPYVREVARAIERDDPTMTLERAIPIAIGRIKKWARGGGDVTADTRAKAAAALAEWEALKAKSGKKFDSELLADLQQKAMPSFIKDKIEARDGGGDDDEGDPKRQPHRYVAPSGGGGLCKKCMAPKGAKVHTDTEDDEKVVRLVESFKALGDVLARAGVLPPGAGRDDPDLDDVDEPEVKGLTVDELQRADDLRAVVAPDEMADLLARREALGGVVPPFSAS